MCRQALHFMLGSSLTSFILLTRLLGSNQNNSWNISKPDEIEKRSWNKSGINSDTDVRIANFLPTLFEVSQRRPCASKLLG